MNVGGSNQRRFSDVYAATGQQRRVSDGWTDDDFLVRLRLDALLSQVVIIPDTYLLDGCYFVSADPQRLASGIGRGITRRELPLEFRTRRSSLAESLRVLLVREDSQYLNRFPFNTIRREDVRLALAQELGRHTNQELAAAIDRADSIPAGLTGFLRVLLDRLGYAADEDLERLQQGWSRWLSAERDGLVRAVTWDAPLDVRDAVRRDPIDPDHELFTAAGRSLHHEMATVIDRGETYRADATLRFHHESGRMTSPEELLDLHTLQSWYDQSRHRAIAHQHHCTSFAHTQDPLVTPVGPLRRRVQSIAHGDVAPGSQNEVAVPEDFFATLVTMSDEAFTQSMVLAAPHLSGWWEHGDIESLRRGLDVVLKSGDGAHARTGSNSLVELFGATVAGTFGAVATPYMAEAGALGGAVLGWLVTRTLHAKIAKDATRRVVEYLVSEHRGMGH